MRARALLVAVAVTASAGRGYAQAPAAPAAAARQLTLEQAIEMARKRNRNLAVERTRVAEAQTSVEQAWAALVPTGSGQGKYTRNNGPFARSKLRPVSTRAKSLTCWSREAVAQSRRSIMGMRMGDEQGSAMI